ncbi:MAG: hypothetical protein ABIK83_07170 [Candidatus Zixiibacteriota bacterium]
MKKKTITLVLLGVVAAYLPMLLSCGDDDCCICPVDPGYQEPVYHFLYSRVGVDYWVYTYNTKTGEAVDSVKYGVFPFWDVRFSKDGRYAYYCNLSFTDDYTVWMTDYASGDTLSLYQGLGGHYLSVSHDGDYLFATDSRDVAIFSLPDLQVVYSDTMVQCGPGCLHPLKNIAYMPTGHEDSLTVIDFQTEDISVEKIPLETLNGYPAAAYVANISNDGSILFMVVFTAGAKFGYLQLRDTETLEILKEYYRFGGPSYFHPDGVRVFYCIPRSWETGEGGEVWVLNLKTLIAEKILDSDDSKIGDPHHLLSFSGMDITPDGRFAFVLGGGGFEDGPIIKLDLKTYRIVDAITPPHGVSRVIRMYPLEIEGG